MTLPVTARAARGLPVAAVLLAGGLLGLTACGGGTVSTGSAPTGSAPSSAPASSAPADSSPASSAPADSAPASSAPTSSTPTSSTPTDPGTATTTTTTGTATGGLPAGFPVPAGATVAGVADDGREIAAQVRVTDTASAFAYYLTALPAAGYTVVSSDRTLLPALAEIRLSGQGFGGNSQLAFTGTTVTVQLDRS